MMDTKKYIYLGSLNRHRSYGAVTDHFIARFTKAGPRKKVELITHTIEVGELVSLLGLDSLLKGLWMVNAELFEKDQGRAIELIKNQLGATLVNPYSLNTIQQPITAKPVATPTVDKIPAAEPVKAAIVKTSPVPPASDPLNDAKVDEQSHSIENKALNKPKTPLSGLMKIS